MVENNSLVDVWIVKIQNPERMIRQGALKELLDFCRVESNLTSENAMEMFDSLYFALTKCYSDRFEMCRSLACSIITEIVTKIERNYYYLEQLVPVIARRFTSNEAAEESEEMRLQLLNQLHFIIGKYAEFNKTGTIRGHTDGDDPILKPYNDIIDVLKESLQDNYPAILKESCEVIKVTAEASPSFHYRAESLVNPLAALLHHRHSPIRIAAIEALGIVALNIYSNAEAVKKIIQGISPLVMDQQAYVRRECGRVGCLFLMKLRDRYGLFERIMPLVLTGLNDDTSEVRDEIRRLWIDAGELYYQENQADLQDLEMIDKIPDNYPPHLQRPTLGCRAMVKRALQVLNSILHEMEDWKDDVRLHSTKLLMQVVIHCENNLETKYYDINAVLCKTCQDKENEVSECALEVAKLVGFFVNPATWVKYLFDELKIRQSKLGVVKCASAMFESSFNENRYEKLNQLSELFLDSAFCQSENEIFQTEFMKFLNIVIKGVNDENDEETFKNFYIVVLSSTTVSYDNETIRTFGIETLHELCAMSSRIKSVNELHEKYLKNALDTLTLLDGTNTSDQFEQVSILYGIICLCSFQKLFLDELKRSIITALEHCEAEGKIKIFSGIATASLNWDTKIGVDDPKENFLMLASFVNEIIAPQLIWQAGRTAESVRTMATASLCSLVQGTSLENSMKLVESLMVPLVSLIDDHNIATRSYTLRILQYFGPLPYEQLKLLAQALLSRLDDPGNEIRECAAKCLRNLELSENDVENLEVWENFLQQILATMLIHLESPEINLQESLLESIKILSRRYPKAYQHALEKSTLREDLKMKLP